MGYLMTILGLILYIIHKYKAHKQRVTLLKSLKRLAENMGLDMKKIHEFDCADDSHTLIQHITQLSLKEHQQQSMLIDILMKESTQGLIWLDERWSILKINALACLYISWC